MTHGALPSITSIVLVVLVMLALFVKTPDWYKRLNPQQSESFPTSKTDPATRQDIEQPFEYRADGSKAAAKPPISNAKIDVATLRRVGAEALWTELAESFQKGGDAPTEAVLTSTDWASFGLPEEEIAFYRSLRSLMNRNGQDFSGDDWLRRFRQAGFIYGEVEAIFERTAPGSSAQPQRVWGNPATLEKLSAAVRAEFNIDSEKTEGFLNKYPQAGPGKWATLVFYLQN